MIDGVIIMQIKFCTENNKRLIHFSTCEVFGKTIGSFLPEEYRKVQQESLWASSFHLEFLKHNMDTILTPR